MKISKVILVSFLSLVGGLILLITIMSVALNDKDKKKYRTNNYSFKTINTPLENFSHILVARNCRVFVLGKRAPSMNYLIDTTTNYSQPAFRIKNDTLFIDSTNISEQINSINVENPNIKSISGDGCRIVLEQLRVPDLDIRVIDSRVRVNHGVVISGLSLNLSANSNFESWNKMLVDTLSLSANQSRLRYTQNKKLIEIKGMAKNHSEIRIPEAMHLNIDLDESSKIKIY